MTSHQKHISIKTCFDFTMQQTNKKLYIKVTPIYSQILFLWKMHFVLCLFLQTNKLCNNVLILVNLFLSRRCIDLTWIKDVHTRLKCNLVNFERSQMDFYIKEMILGSQNWQDYNSNGCVHPLFKWDLCSDGVKIGNKYRHIVHLVN